MINTIKKKIEKELRSYLAGLNTDYSLSRISPVLYRHIHDFLLRKGKRLRPILFTLGYLGYAKRPAPGLYRSALSLELLHDFMLVHDDIIDKSDTRRGKPSMHVMLNQHLAKFNNLKFNGSDLTIVIGDVMYALALHSFLSIKEDKARKEKALQKLIEAAIYTGSGEFIELLYGTRTIEKMSKQDVYKIYDLKTANYTFSSPLTIGATLAGASTHQLNILYHYGIYLGRAFQIKDDILGMFCEEKKTGKSSLSDLREAKKTILIVNAYANADAKDRKTITYILTKKNASMKDLLIMRRIIEKTHAKAYAKEEMSSLLRKAGSLHNNLTMKPFYKQLLKDYAADILDV